MKSTPIHAAQPLEPGKSTSQALELRLGQVVQARVIQQTQNGIAQLKIGNHIVEAHTKSNLPVDTILPLVVEKAGMNTIAKALNMPMKITSPAEFYAQTPKSIQNWRAGQIFGAQVILPIVDGKVALKINNHTLNALTNQTHIEKSTIQIKLINTQPLLHFQLHSKDPSNSATTQAAHKINTDQPFVKLPLQLNISTTAIDNKTINALASVQSGKLVIQNIDAKQPATTILSKDTFPIKLQIIHPGKLPQLKLSRAPATPDIISANLRQLLPQHATIAAALASISLLAKSESPLPASLISNSTPPNVAEQLKNIARQIYSSIIISTNTNSRSIKSAINNSGLIFEQQLLQNSLNPNIQLTAQDLKANFIRLLTILNTLRLQKSNPSSNSPLPLLKPPTKNGLPQTHEPIQQLARKISNWPKFANQLLQQIKGGLARIQLNQIVSLAADDDSKRVVTTEIPILHGEQIGNISIRIEQEQNSVKDKKNQKHWNIILAFEFDTLGPVYATISFTQGISNITFWSEDIKIKSLIDSNLTLLQKQLQSLGIKIGLLNCNNSLPPSPLTDANGSPSIVDIKA